MKPSRIALLSLGGVVLLAMVAVAVVARVALGRDGAPDASVKVSFDSGSGGTSASSLGLTGFKGVQVDGRWNVAVARGDEWRVDLEPPECDVRTADVAVHDGRLRLSDARSSSLFGGSRDPLRAKIVMPALVHLKIAGESRVTFSGFEGDTLVVEAAGVTDLSGRDGRYAKLDLSLAGAGNAELDGIVVTDAHVEIAGATNLTLTMDGGELTGGLAGAGRIVYSGSVSRESVDIAGFGSVGPAEP